MLDYHVQSRLVEGINVENEKVNRSTIEDRHCIRLIGHQKFY